MEKEHSHKVFSKRTQYNLKLEVQIISNYS